VVDGEVIGHEIYREPAPPNPKTKCFLSTNVDQNAATNASGTAVTNDVHERRSELPSHLFIVDFF
jgi:hypothetical protein